MSCRRVCSRSFAVGSGPLRGLLKILPYFVSAIDLILAQFESFRDASVSDGLRQKEFCYWFAVDSCKMSLGL